MAARKTHNKGARRTTPRGKTKTYRNPLLRALAVIGLFPAQQTPARRAAPATRGKSRRRDANNPERRFLHHLEV